MAGKGAGVGSENRAEARRGSYRYGMAHQCPCAWCDATFWADFGTHRLYCSWACRQRAKEFRKYWRRRGVDPAPLLARLLAWRIACRRAQSAGEPEPARPRFPN